MNSERQYWLESMLRIASPVLEALSERRLKATMPVEQRTGDREQYTYLEALGRTLAGLAPWLENTSLTGEEGEKRERYAAMSRASIAAAVDPASPDYMNFNAGGQPVVDAAFLAHAIVRAPQELWEKLDDETKRSLIRALKLTRAIRPVFSNWLLFSAMIETALHLMGEDWDPMRVDYAVRQHEQWYAGDGAYSDGPDFHWDYYNSFVIHPMLVDILEQLGDRYADWRAIRERVNKRATRYAAVMERMISPEGTFPPIGRSLAYRFGAFQLLAQVALRRQLPQEIVPAQVRCALSAVIRRTLEMPETFDADGWLTIGFAGHQPDIGEGYISTGSLYLCSTVFLPLGLPADDPFWQGEAVDWTAKRIWSGGRVPIDHALHE